MSSSPELPSSLVQTIPWNEEEGAIWIGSSLILRRNLAHHNFPSKLSPPEREQVQQDLQNGLKGMENLHFYHQKELSSADRELVYEHFLFL